MGAGASNGNVSWHDVRDMSPPELADFMAQTCDSSFTKHYQAIIDNAVGGGIVCSLGKQSLRTFLTDINITLKPQQDFIIEGLDKLNKTTEVAVAALEESGSPYKHTVVRNLRTHNAAYVTFTKEGDTFRGATKFAKGLRRTIGSAWDPPNVPVNIRLRGSGSLGVTGGPLLQEVAQSLNMVWLISAGSLEDPFCLMEVCAAVRQGTPVLPVRLAGAGMRPLNIPIWTYSIQVKPSRSGATTSSTLTASSTDDTAVVGDANTKNGPGKLEKSSDLKGGGGGSGGGEHQLAATGVDAGNTATEFRERGRRLRRRAVDGFYAQLAQRLPKQVQAELHRNRFLVKDVIAAVRSCFEGTGESETGDTGQAGAGATGTRSDKAASATVSKARAKPPVFDISDQPAEHDMLLTALVGVNRRNTGKANVEDVANRDKGRESGSSSWNWEQVPRSAPLAGRARLTDAVPWRSDEEVSEMIKMEEAEADDLAGLLVNDMRTHPSSEQHQWEGCKGLADLAARDSDGLSAVRRQGGIQAILAALAACPKDADVQRWGCQALVPLFSDPIVATPFRQAGIAAVIRALAVLSCCEAALKSMGAVGGAGGGSAARGGRAKATAARTRWTRAVKKLEIYRVREQRRASLEKSEAAVRAIQREEEELAKKIEARRKSIELELQKEIEAEDEAAVADASDAAETIDAGEARDNTNSDEGPSLESVDAATTAAAAGARGSIDGKNKEEGRTAAEQTTPEGQEESEIENNGDTEENNGGTEEKNKDDSSICDDALAEEQRRLEEQDRLEHEAEIARLKKIQDANKLDQWAMTDADIAIYDKAFFKQDKDKDGFISPHEAKSMFKKARTSEDARRHIWEMCDPYRRGKLTQHGWRVAYHLARSMKSRKLELPEALPLCLYPPGFVPGASTPAEKGNDAVDAPEGGNRSQANREANRKGDRGSVGNGGPAGANEDRGASVGGGEGEAGGAKGNVRGKTQEKNNGKEGGGMFSRKKPASANSSTKGKEGGKEMEAMELQEKVKTESVGEKETAEVVLGPSEDMDNDKNKRKTKKKKTKATKEKKEVDTNGSDKYHMSDAQKTGYTNVFDKLTKGKPEKKIGGKQAATMLAKSGLSKTDLGHLWAMADADRDGKLSRHEFAVAMHLAARAVGTPALALPSVLPPCLAAASATENEGNREGDGRVAAAEEAGSVVLVDDTSSVVSSLGYPEGLSDVDSETGGDAASGTRDNAPEKATGEEEKGRQESKKGVASSDPVPARTDEMPEKMTGMTKKALDEDHARGQKDKKEAVAGDGEGEGSAKTRSSSEEKEKEGGSEYRMSDQDAARYDKAFNKLVKGKGVTLGGKEAAVVLAKSGLGKRDLGRLWAMSDVDRDGALSRMEFSIAMHLVSCSAKKGLPVPRALPESLGALLPQPEVQSEEIGNGVATSAEETTTTTGSTNTREKLETPSASSDSGGTKGRRNKRGAVAGKKMAEAVEDNQGRYTGYDNKKAGTIARTKKEGGKGEKGNKNGSRSAAATTEKEAGSSKKRGCGMVSSAAVATTAGESETSAAAEDGITGETTNHASPAEASGGKNKKRSKKATPGDQDQEHHKDDKHDTTTAAAAAAAAKRRPASRDKTLVMEEAGRLKPLEKPQAPKKNKKGKSSSPARIADKVGSAGEAEESVSPEPDQQSGSDNDHAKTLALVSVPEERREGRLTAAKGGKYVAEVAAGSVEGDADRAETETEGEDAKTPTKENMPLSREERDQLYGMSTSERAGYDVIFMQIDADHNGTIDGREAANLLCKSGLTRAQLSKIWGLADANDNGELDHDEWAVALHLCRCVAHKHLPLPETLPRSLGGLGLAGGPDDDEEQPDGGRDQGPKGSKAIREAEQAREKEKKAMAGRAVKLREQTQAFRLGKVTAAAFYITLAGAFGAKRHTMIPKVARSLPLDRARALVVAAGLGEEVLEDNEVAEAKLAALRRRRVDEANLHVKATTSNATARDVSLLACRLANRLSATLDDENGGARGAEGVGGDTLGAQTSVAADMASAGGVDAAALIFRMFGALDLELMVEALQFSLILARACSAVPIDEEPASETSSLASSSHSLVEDRVVETAPEPSPLLPLLRPLYAPSVCKRVAEVAKQFSHSRKTQRLVCLLVGELGSTCGAPARRCFADCCEPIVVASAGGLDEHAASDSDGSSVLGGTGGGGKNGLSTSIVASSLPGQGVRDVACQALSVLAQESGLSRRLVAAGAGKASAVALAAAPREHSVQLYGLETIALLAESSCSPGMWESTTIDAPCRLAVQSVQTFIRDANIHRAASRAILALLVGDAAGDASRSIAAAGGATALARVLATSPNVREVQLPAVLAINELLERCRSSCAESVPTPVSEPGEEDDSVSAAAAEPGKVERELIAAAGCELLCKSAKAFPRDRDLRLGCLRAMGALCRGARQAAVGRLIAAGVCEQLMKILGAYPDDIEVRRAGLALLVGVSEHGEGTTEASDDETEENDDQDNQITTGALASRLGFVGAVDFAGVWLRQVTAPTWAWVAGHGGGGGEEDELARAWDLLMSCKAAFLLTRHSSTNRDRLTSMGAMEALSRAVALSGRKNNLKVGLTPPVGLQQDSTLSVQAETQLWAVQALTELSGGQDNENRCSALMRCGALRALLAAMNKSNSASQLQRAGCMALGNVASCLKPKDLQALGRNGGAQAVTGAFEACPGDKDVALAGLLAVAKLSMSSENRRLLGQAGVCPMISKELLDFSHDEAVAEEGCRAVTRLAALSGFNRTALGHARAAEATATALLKHPSKPRVQRWGLSAAAALVAETDPSGNTDRITSAGILGLAVKALMKFRHNPTVQAEGLKTFAKVATSGKDGNDAVWAAGVVLTVVRALGLYLNDANVQHWGVATMRALTGSDDRCDVWRGAGAPEAVVRTLVAFGRDGTGRHARHDEEGLGRASETRPCTAEESLCVQFQACATAFNLAMSSPDARRRIVREGAGEALAGMMKSNSSNQAALRGALATLAALSASGVENRKRLHRYKGGVPKAVASALESFPEDRRVRCEGALTVQNLSLTLGGARAMTKAGVAPVIIRLLRTTLEESSFPTTSEREGEREEGPTLNGAIANGHSGGKQADRDVIVYLLNGLANMAAADKSLSDFIGRHGACEAVVFALEHHPRDLQMQASGVKAVRALALGGCRNVQDLARLRGPSAIARAQGLFLRDREIQLAVGAAMEALCRGGNRANREALVGAGTIVLLESALSQFASDAEVVSQSFRALVEIVLAGSGPKAVMGAEGEDNQRCSRSVAGVEEEPPVKRSFSLPQLTLTEGKAAIKGPLQPGEDAGGTVGGVAVGEVSCAVGMVLAVLERNPCREVCLEAFSALGRLLVNLGATDSESVSVGSNDVRDQTYQNRVATTDDTSACHKVPHNGMKGGVNAAGGLLQLAKVRHAVKRALKINRCDDVDLALRGGQIITLTTVARGRALAQ